LSGALRIVNPETLPAPRGFSHGVQGTGETLFVAGQIGTNQEGKIVDRDFVAQFGQALDNVLAVVRAAGGTPQRVARMVVYVTDKRQYLARQKDLGTAWRQRFGRHYPAMALVEVKGLVEDSALVEIEAVALISPREDENPNASRRALL
jgi:enamine deaminase RidA (YjgF/YER057c/UK114 family)